MSGMGLSEKGGTLTIVESSTKHYPTNFVVSPEMEHLKAASCPDLIRQLIRGVLTMAHMDGADPLPLPRPFVRG